MANKNTSTNKKAEQVFIDLLYMTSSELKAKDLANLIQHTEGVLIELWDEMNVLELELPNKNSVDFEPLSINFKDPSDAAFVKNRGIRTIFSITLCENDLDAVKPVFEKIVNQYSGFVCADSGDFTPVYVGSSKK